MRLVSSAVALGFLFLIPCTGCSSSHATNSPATQRARACVAFSAAVANSDASARASMLQEAHAAALASGDRDLAAGMDPVAVTRARTTGGYASFVRATADRCKAEGWKASNACTFGRKPCAGEPPDSTLTPTTTP